MSYVEFFIFMIVATMILIVAFDGYSHVLQHMAYILDTNSKTLRAFHMINYLRFDYHRHSLTQANIKFTKTNSYTTFSFDERIDTLKRVLYKAVPYEGNTTIFRDVYEPFGSGYKLINRRMFTVDGEYRLVLSTDGKFLEIHTSYYDKCIIPTKLPNVQIISIIVQKVE
ncbi:hypothetical protein [Fervidobacterium sp.]